RDAPAQLLGVREPRRERRELDVLAGLGIDPFDLDEPEPQELCFTCALGRGADERVELSLHARALAPRFAVLVDEGEVRAARELVEREPLARRSAKPRLLRLAVHRDKLVGDLPEN